MIVQILAFSEIVTWVKIKVIQTEIRLKRLVMSSILTSLKEIGS